MSKLDLVKIDKLTMRDYAKVMELFLDCFIDDSYYMRLIPDEEERNIWLLQVGGQAIEYCLKQDYCFGAWYDDSLVGFVLCLDYSNSSKSDREMIFGYHNDLPKIFDEHDDGQLLYLMLIAVRKDMREQGIGSELLDTVMREYSEYSIISDVSNSDSVRMYERRDFSVRKLSYKYYLVLHKKG